MKSDFVAEFNRIREAMDAGKTPVYSELRSAKTSLLELFPSLLIQSVLLVISTFIVSLLNVGELVQVVILLVMNTTTQTLSFVVLVLLKHIVRAKRLKKYGILVNERNIAVLECMEYQSV